MFVNEAPKYGNDYAYDEEEMVEDIPHMMDNVDVEGKAKEFLNWNM